MNILYIWDSDYPWDVRVEKICKTLTENGHNVHIAARNLNKLQEYEINSGLHVHRLKSYKSDKLNYTLSFPAFFSPIWARFLHKIIRGNLIELIIVRDLPMAIAGIWAGKRGSIPVMFDMAEDYFAMITAIWKVRKFKGLNLVVRNPYMAKLVEKYTFKKVDYILTVIDEARDLVIKRGGRPDRVTIVGNTPLLESFNTNGNADNRYLERIRNSYSVIYTGGVQMGRGIQVMIDAIPQIIKDIPDFLFVVVGSGYAVPELKELMLEKNVQDYVLWIGWVDHKNMFDYLKACKAGIIPHLTSDHVNTTIPNKIFDYMGLSLPVISSDAVPLKRVVEEEKCGIFFKSGDAADLTRAVVQMHSSKEPFGQNGKSSVMAKYNWEQDTKRLLNAVDICVSKNPDKANPSKAPGKIQFREITADLQLFTPQINLFLDNLNSEKKYFNLNFDRIVQCENVIAMFDNDKVAGIGGVETKFGLARGIIMINKRYPGLGRKLLLQTHETAKTKHDIIMGVIREENTASIRNNLSVGYKIVGKREELYYLICPLSKKGELIVEVIKFMFPIVNLIDFFRK